ncbi:MAG: acyltransferase [Caulobacteraceae bacterium]|nr:acyltransferase [Caulobacteraceae bacterium]
MSAAPEGAQPQRRLPEIVSVQYLRAAAALAVVVFHSLEATPAKFPVGAAGVDVFFVISGFIMWTLTESGESSPTSFIWRRLARVAPPYWVATLLVVAVATLRPHFLWMPGFSPADIVRSLLFIPFQDAWGKPSPVLIQGWTLDYEMFFYALFAASLIAPRRRRLVIFSGLIALLITAGLLAKPSGPAAAVYTSLMLAEFLAGVWLGRLWTAGSLPRSAPLGLALALLGLAAFALEQVLGVGEGPLRTLYWGLPALALVSGALMLEGAGFVRLWRVPKAVGDGSYSIYLFHVFVVALGYRVLPEGPTALRVAATVIASAAAGWLLYIFLERPLTAAVRRLPGRLKLPPPQGPAVVGAPHQAAGRRAGPAG